MNNFFSFLVLTFVFSGSIDAQMIIDNRTSSGYFVVVGEHDCTPGLDFSTTHFVPASSSILVPNTNPTCFFEVVTVSSLVPAAPPFGYVGNQIWRCTMTPNPAYPLMGTTNLGHGVVWNDLSIPTSINNTIFVEIQ